MSIKEFEGGLVSVARVQQAYGFAKRKDLAEYLGISPSTFSTWGSRGFFPADLVAKCAIETGARLRFLAYGEEPMFDESSDMKYFHTIGIENGKSFIKKEKGLLLQYFPNLTSREDYENIFCVEESNHTYFCLNEFDLTDGEYFVIIENSHLIRYITVLPQGKIRVDGGKFSFEANVADVKIMGKVILKMEKML